MSRFSRLITELHRRSIWQVLGIYAVGAWVAYQVVLSLVDGLGLPDWVSPFAIVLFIIGLPIVLATAFVQEGLPSAQTPSTDPSGQDPGAVQPTMESPVSPGPRPLRRTLTWSRSITAGVLAFAVLGLGAAGFMGMRAFGIGPVGSLVARGELDARDPVLVADFESATGDSVLARVVAEAFRVDLAQSQFIGLVDRSRIREALDRMGRDASTELRGDVARDVAVRLGLKALVEGEVSGAGGAYLLAASLVTPDSGRVLASFRETAKDSTDLLPAVDRLTKDLREKVGESLRTIRSNPPLTQVTTSSLPALRKYMEGRLTPDGDRAMELFRDALALDSTFANAHRALAVAMWNRGLRDDSMLHHLHEAVRQGNRLTEQELHHARGMLDVATGRRDDARREFETLLSIDSTDDVALVNLSVVYSDLGQPARAEELNRRALALGRGSARTAAWNILMAELDQSHFDAADSTIASWETTEVRGTDYPRWLLAMTRADYDGADSLLHTWNRPSPFVQGLTDATRGRWGSAMQQWRSLADRPDECDVDCLFDAFAQLWVWNDPDAAVARVDALLQDPALDSLPFAQRPYPQLALVLAEAGRTQQARALAARFEAGIPAELRFDYEPQLLAARAFADAHEGRPDSAVAELRLAQRRANCAACLGALRGQVFEMAAMPDSALAAYEAYIDTGWQDRFQFFPAQVPNDPFLLAFAHERAAAIADRLGDRERARVHYAALVHQWQHADPGLLPRVRAAQARLEQLVGEGG